MTLLKFEKIINNILLALFLLIPFALITGSFLPDLFLSLSAALLIVLLVKKKQLVGQIKYKYSSNQRGWLRTNVVNSGR